MRQRNKGNNRGMNSWQAYILKEEIDQITDLCIHLKENILLEWGYYTL